MDWKNNHLNRSVFFKKNLFWIIQAYQWFDCYSLLRQEQFLLLLIYTYVFLFLKQFLKIQKGVACLIHMS